MSDFGDGTVEMIEEGRGIMADQIKPEAEEPREEVERLTRKLAEPFDVSEVKFKPAVVSGTRALALAYVDARVVQDRLDEVLGVDGWQDDYEHLPDGNILCRLRCRIVDQWILKTDVGGPSEQPDGGDRTKAAVSDALKRAAVKFGIGRYLYRLPQQWVDYDAKAKRIAQPPILPAWALPKNAEGLGGEVQGVRGQGTGDKKQRAAKREEASRNQGAGNRGTEEKAVEKETPPAATAKPRVAAGGGHALPANGAELLKRLQDYEAKLVAQGVCRRGALVEHVTQMGVKAGYSAALTEWTGPAFTLAAEETRRFEAQARRQPPDRKEVA